MFLKFGVVHGYVYLLSNPAMPGVVKIGHTRGALKSRVDQLSSATGIPRPFEIEAVFMSEKPREEEQLIHQALSDCRAPGREFFAIPLNDALHKCADLLQRDPQFVRQFDGDFSEP